MLKLPSAEALGNPVRDLWDRLSGKPGGVWLFNRIIGLMVPYTGSLGAQVVELRTGYSKVVLTERRAVRNHLRSVHALALGNMAELAGNMALQYSLADDQRFIVKAMAIDYVKKARGTITAECHCTAPPRGSKHTLEIGITLRDASGVVVTEVRLTSVVGPKKASAQRVAA
ncbi:MAG: acyl-coenzyme A thioesterase PaaI-like protein [Myxococcota bacterium]|jgi:acyl-coenzyme A thioesterase PaaI-like protein